MYVELGGILTEEQMWTTAAPVFEKLLETYRRIYSSPGDYRSERESVGDSNVLALIDSEKDSRYSDPTLGAEQTTGNPLLHQSSTAASSDFGE